MPNEKQLWVLAGGNGSGKSTFYKHYLETRGIKFLNADLIAKEINPDHPETVSYEAANAAKDIREEMLDKGEVFCFETVFSHPSKIEFVQLAKAKGYSVVLVYIHLNDSSLNEARVHQRTTEGGHDVPTDKIHSRIPRTMQCIKRAAMLVDEVWILDNSSESDRFKQIAVKKNDKIEIKVDPPPEWLFEILPFLCRYRGRE